MISCAMIAWNEATTIDLAIKSLRGVADEVVIVDTGSFDGTQKVAKTAFDIYKINGYIVEEKARCLRDARKKSIELCKGAWILLLDANQVISSTLGEVFLKHSRKHRGRVCAFRSLNLMGDYEHYFLNMPFMNWHMAFFERGGGYYQTGTIADRPRFKSQIVSSDHWAVNLSRVRPAWRSWYRGEPFDKRFFKKGDENYCLKTSYMDRWSKAKKYDSIIDYMREVENITPHEVRQLAPEWYLDQLRRNATPLTKEMRASLPEVIKEELKNPRYKLIYDKNSIIGRHPEL